MYGVVLGVGDGILSVEFGELFIEPCSGDGSLSLPSFVELGYDLSDGKRGRRIGRRNGRDRPSLGGGTNPNNRRAKPDLEASSRGLNNGLSAMTTEASLDERCRPPRRQQTRLGGRHNSQLKEELSGRRLRRPKAERQDRRRFWRRLDARSASTRGGGSWGSGCRLAKSRGRDPDRRSRRRRMCRPIIP